MPLTERKLVLAKVEAAYATDPVHALTDAALVHDFQWRFVSERYARAVTGPSLTPRRAAVLGKRHVEITFKTEIHGRTGAFDATNGPGYHNLIRGAAVSATFAAGPVTWTYAPVSTGFESVAIEFEIDGLVCIALGCRGNAKIVLVPGERGMIEWRFLGLFTLPSDRVIETGDYTDDVAPPIVAATGIQPWTDNPTADVYGHVRKIEIDLRNRIVSRESATVGAEGIAAFVMVGRGSVEDPGIAVTLEVEMKANPDGDDFFTRWNSRTISAAVTATLGSAQAENEHQILIRGLVINDIQLSDFDGRVGHVLDCRSIGSAADNDFSIVAT